MIAGAAIGFGRRLPSDALRLRFREDIVGRLHVILPRPLQSFGQAMAAAMPPTLIRASAAARRVHAGKRLALIFFDGCQRRRWQWKREAERDRKIKSYRKPTAKAPPAPTVDAPRRSDSSSCGGHRRAGDLRGGRRTRRDRARPADWLPHYGAVPRGTQSLTLPCVQI